MVLDQSTIENILGTIVDPINRAIILASIIHDGQFDKAGTSYIKHPLELATMLCDYPEEYNIFVTATLHDIIEDGPCWIEDVIMKFFNPQVYDNLKILTRSKKMSYTDYILRIIKHEIPRHVKIMDLKRNMDMTRLTKITPTTMQRLKKYQTAYQYLTGRITEGSFKAIMSTI